MNYIVNKTIAKGSFGEIYLGTHNALNIKAAIKKRLKQKKDDEQYLQMFEDEAYIVSLFNHPSLPVFREYEDIGDFRSDQILILNWIEGETLTDLVKWNGFIDDEHLCWIFSRLLDALSYIHYLGVIHCDITPNNIIINTKIHNASLIDFGLAFYQPNATAKAKGGTPEYLPPEFAQGKPPLPQSDLYSLAKVFLYASGGNVNKNTYHKTTDEVLQNFFNEMLRQDPLTRPDSAADLLLELTGIRKKLFGRTSTLEEIKYK